MKWSRENEKCCSPNAALQRKEMHSGVTRFSCKKTWIEHNECQLFFSKKNVNHTIFAAHAGGVFSQLHFIKFQKWSSVSVSLPSSFVIIQSPPAAVYCQFVALPNSAKAN